MTKFKDDMMKFKDDVLSVYYACKATREGVMDLSMPMDGCLVSFSITKSIQEMINREGLSLFDGIEFQVSTKRKKSIAHYPLHEDSPTLPWLIALVGIQVPGEILYQLTVEGSYDKKTSSMRLAFDQIDYLSIFGGGGPGLMMLSLIEISEMDLEFVEEGNYAILHKVCGNLCRNNTKLPLEDVLKTNQIPEE